MHNLKENKQKIYDLSTQICETTTVFPGCPIFEHKTLACLEQGSVYGLCHISMPNHVGTHVDYPGHVVKNGKLSHDFSLSQLIGHGRIVKVPHTQKAITKQFINECQLRAGEIVLFSTANSKIQKKGPIHPNFVYLQIDAAEELIKKKVRIVGIDYLSIDKFDRADLPVHQLLLKQNILIVEGLELGHVEEGKYNISIVPLNVPNMDGLPARVFCIKLQ